MEDHAAAFGGRVWEITAQVLPLKNVVAGLEPEQAFKTLPGGDYIMQTAQGQKSAPEKLWPGIEPLQVLLPQVGNLIPGYGVGNEGRALVSIIR